MREDELLTLIAQGESGELEFKSDEIAPDKLARGIVAFANWRGGRILMGVDDSGNVVGWQRDKPQEWLMDTVARLVHPSISIDYNEIVCEDRRVGIITVPQGMEKPYFVRRPGGGGIPYIRMGNINSHASREQIMRMADASGGFYEKLPVPGGDYRHSLNMQLVENYFRDIVETKYDSAAELEMLMRNRDFLVMSETREGLFASSFAHILFANNPLRELPQAGIRILAFRGSEMETDILLDEKLDAPFLGYVPSTINLPSIPDMVISYLRQYISREKVCSDMRRQRTWDYPPDALRELIVNAFAHREWARTNQIRIAAFADRLEITSPGALPNGMTMEKIKSGEQNTRNPKIVHILRHYRFVEDIGMGIRRKVIPLMREHNDCEPEFIPDPEGNFFRVILRKRK